MPDPAAVNSMFGRIAPRYDLANRVLSGGVDLRWRRLLVEEVRQGGPRDVLDLATGSGDVAFALARALPAGTRIVGMDFCAPMLEQAEAKKRRRSDGPETAVRFQLGDGLCLPAGDASFDAVTISFGLRNMADRARCLAEIRRVLRPGGRLFVLEFSQPRRWFGPLYRFYLLRLSPWIAGSLTGDRSAYRYLGDSIRTFPGREALSREITAAGYASVNGVSLTLGIVALHSATTRQ